MTDSQPIDKEKVKAFAEQVFGFLGWYSYLGDDLPRRSHGALPSTTKLRTNDERGISEEDRSA